MHKYIIVNGNEVITRDIQSKIGFICNAEIVSVEPGKVLNNNYLNTIVFIDTDSHPLSYKSMSKNIEKNNGRVILIGSADPMFSSVRYPLVASEIISLGISSKVSSIDNIGTKYVGKSNESSALMRMLELAAKYDSTLLISGESGVGKEVASQAVHNMSSRGRQPFVAINCAAIPDALLESELFGYEKGAFTGALSQKKGKFEQADGGTIFLDEIGDMPLLMQTKLLRVLQERKVQRVGGKGEIDVNVRVIAATNKILKDKVADGTFREDLWYRLNVLPVVISPIRDRKDDIIPLMTYFASKKLLGGLLMSDDAKHFFINYPWPGNVREISNIIERISVFYNGIKISKEDAKNIVLGLPNSTPANIQDIFKEEVSNEIQNDKSLKDSVSQFEKELICRALLENEGSISGASVALKVKRTTMLEKIKRMDIAYKNGKANAI